MDTGNQNTNDISSKISFKVVEQGVPLVEDKPMSKFVIWSLNHCQLHNPDRKASMAFAMSNSRSTLCRADRDR